MKLHRAVTLGVLIVLALVLVATMTAGAIGSADGGSLAALALVVVAAAVAGVAFSWKRYFGR